jgi:hypothetical protein
MNRESWWENDKPIPSFPHSSALPSTEGRVKGTKMSRVTVPVINRDGDIEHVKAESMSLALRDARPSTLAVHADEVLRLVDDIAPPIHVSTTYKYPDDPELLKPFYGREIGVCKPISSSVASPLTLPRKPSMCTRENHQEIPLDLRQSCLLC